MICEECGGIRDERKPPCAECGGCGITSCCDGAVGGPSDVGNRPYDPEADLAGSWWLAMREIGRRVRSGEPVPKFLRSERKPQ